MQTAHPVWWTSDNYRNSSFRIYHVDSVFSFSLVWPLLNLLDLYIYYIYSWSSCWQFSFRYITTTPRPLPCVFHDELWTNGRTDCVHSVSSRNTKSVQTLWSEHWWIACWELVSWYKTIHTNWLNKRNLDSRWLVQGTYTQNSSPFHMASTCIIWWYLFTLFESDFGPSLNAFTQQSDLMRYVIQSFSSLRILLTLIHSLKDAFAVILFKNNCLASIARS